MSAQRTVGGAIRPVTVVATFVLFWVGLLGLSLLARNRDPLPNEPPAPPSGPAEAWNHYAAALGESSAIAVLRSAGASSDDPYGNRAEAGKLRWTVRQTASVLDYARRVEDKTLFIEQRLPSYSVESEFAAFARDQIRLNPHQLVNQFRFVADAYVLRGDLARAEGRLQAALDDYKAALRYTARLKSAGGIAPYIGACLSESLVLRRLAGLTPSLDAKQTANVQEALGKLLAASQVQWAWEREAALGETWLYRLLRDDRAWRETLIGRAKARDPTFADDGKAMRRKDLMTAYRLAMSYGQAAMSNPPSGPVVSVPALVRAVMPPYGQEDDQIAKANRAEIVLLTVAIAAKRYRAAKSADALPRVVDLTPFMPKLYPFQPLDPFTEGPSARPTMLRMASDQDGGLCYWSVGPNGSDDGGQVWRSAGKPPRSADLYDSARGDVTIRLTRSGRLEYAGRFGNASPRPKSAKVGPGP